MVSFRIGSAAIRPTSEIAWPILASLELTQSPSAALKLPLWGSRGTYAAAAFGAETLPSYEVLEPGVARDSRVETFTALRLEIDSWRWKGVPFYIRAGKCLPVTCTEIVVRWRQPPTMFADFALQPNYCRMRISPDITIALGANAIASGQEGASEVVEMLFSHDPGPEEMDAYERLLRDALAGDATLFAREDYVEEAWRIVDPVLKTATPPTEYEPGTWGPTSPEVTPPGGWQDPVVAP